METTALADGVIAARTLLDNSVFQSAVCVLNLSDKCCKIKEGTCLADAQEACVCGSVESLGDGPGAQPSATPVAGTHQRPGGGLATRHAAE